MMRSVWIGIVALALATPGVAQSPALPDKASAGKSLADCRGRIDALDARIVALLNERAQIVQEVGRIKQQTQAPVTAPKRVEEVLRKAADHNSGPLPSEAVQRIYGQIIREMTQFERAEMQRGGSRPK